MTNPGDSAYKQIVAQCFSLNSEEQIGFARWCLAEYNRIEEASMVVRQTDCGISFNPVTAATDPRRVFSVGTDLSRLDHTPEIESFQEIKDLLEAEENLPQIEAGTMFRLLERDRPVLDYIQRQQSKGRLIKINGDYASAEFEVSPIVRGNIRVAPSGPYSCCLDLLVPKLHELEEGLSFDRPLNDQASPT
jgi:hypothetical protein